LYLRQRRLVLRLERGTIDPFEAEEEVLNVVAAVIARAAATIGRGDNSDWKWTDARRTLVEGAREEISRTPFHPTDVFALARQLQTSPYHLCRGFRKGTGLTLHAYRLDLRLRTVLECLSDTRTDLSRLALTVGFSSHSHFSAIFRARYGMTPTECRRALS
jgi:AraC-like DNA-binding protein